MTPSSKTKVRRAPKREERVLAYVNRIRAELGYRPRKALAKGVPGDSCKCPVARSLPHLAEVDDTELEVYTYGENGGIYGRNILLERKLPGYVSKFVSDFDFGKYPHLEKRA